MLNQSLEKMINKERISEIAIETVFTKRERKIDAYDLFLSLVFHSSKQLPVSLRNLAVFFSKKVSRTAVHKKFNEKGTLFFKRCLQHVLSQKVQGDCKVETPLLENFNEIKLIDSSSWNISPGLREYFPGSGGAGSPAGSKVQLFYEYKTGTIHSSEITKGTLPDQKYSELIAQKINKNDLVIFDLGYWTCNTFMEIEKKEAYFISRLNTNVNLWLKEDNGDFVKFELENFLKKQKLNSLEFYAYLNKEQKNRIVAFRIPEEVANMRRAKLIKNSKKKGRTPSKKSLNMCDWSIFITNCEENKVPGEMIRSFYRIRWTIELIFKNWKSIVKIHKCNVRTNKNRFLCELYAKLIFAVIIHRSYQYVNSNLWKTERKEISFWCLCNYIADHSQLLHEAAKTSVKKFIGFFNLYIDEIFYNCIKYYQPSRKTTLQYIDEMIGDIVPIKISSTALLQQQRLS